MLRGVGGRVRRQEFLRFVSEKEVVNMQYPYRRYDWLDSLHPNRAWTRGQHLQSLDEHRQGLQAGPSCSELNSDG